MTTLIEAAIQAAIAQRMAVAALGALDALQRQHPWAPLPALDAASMGAAAARALADPALVTRVRLLALAYQPSPGAAVDGATLAPHSDGAAGIVAADSGVAAVTAALPPDMAAQEDEPDGAPSDISAIGDAS